MKKIFVLTILLIVILAAGCSNNTAKKEDSEYVEEEAKQLEDETIVTDEFRQFMVDSIDDFTSHYGQ